MKPRYPNAEELKAYYENAVRSGFRYFAGQPFFANTQDFPRSKQGDILQLIVRQDMDKGETCAIYQSRELVAWGSNATLRTRRALKAGEIVTYIAGVENEDLIAYKNRAAYWYNID